MSENDLIIANQAMVAKIARKFRPKNQFDLDDYISAGNIGLLKAIRKYDSSKAKLSTIAWYYIKWEIIKSIKKNKRLICGTKIEREYHTKDSLLNFLSDNLTPLEQNIIELKYSGYSLREIGENLNKPQSIVVKLYTSAMKKLRTANNVKEKNINT